MRKFLMLSLVLGGLLAASGPALADDQDDDRDRGRYQEVYERRYDDRAERRYDDRADRRDDDRWDDRRDGRYSSRPDGFSRRGGGWAYLNYGLRDRPLRDWVMRRFDYDRDGQLTRAEAFRAERTFERIADRDGNGRVSPREALVARDRLMRRGGDYAYRR